MRAANLIRKLLQEDMKQVQEIVDIYVGRKQAEVKASDIASAFEKMFVRPIYPRELGEVTSQLMDKGINVIQTEHRNV